MKAELEQDLIQRAVKHNDQRAFSHLVNEHQSKLRYSLRQLCNFNEALADDLAQETFILAFKQLPKFRGDAKFSSWLYRIGYNVFLAHVRKKQLDVQSYDEHPILETHAEPSSNSQLDDQSALHQRVAELMAQIEPERRSVLHLFLHRQHTQQEISEIMGIPLGTVKTHINRGRATLQASLTAWKAA